VKICTDRKLITCIIPKGKAIGIIRQLNEEKGITTANVSSGRGQGVVEPDSFKGWAEVDILEVVMGEDQAEEIFEYLYEKAEIGRMFGGFMYQGKLSESTTFSLPSLPLEE